MPRIYPVTSQIVQTVSSLSLSADGSAVVTIGMGTLVPNPQEGGEPVFNHITNNAYQLPRADFEAAVAATPRLEGESLVEHMSAAALASLQASGRILK